MISQLGNVVQSSVEESGRSEAGGLQYTGQQLGSSLGVALIGAIVLIGLTSTFISNVQNDPRISAEVSAQVGVAAGSNTNFVSSDTDRERGDRRPASTSRPRRRWSSDYESGPAPIAQGRPPRCRAPRPPLPRVHQGATPFPTNSPEDHGDAAAPLMVSARAPDAGLAGPRR